MAARIAWDDLIDRPTLSTGQADNLKIDTGKTRYWVSRCGIADGLSTDHLVTVERLTAGRWEAVDEYDGMTLETAAQ